MNDGLLASIEREVLSWPGVGKDPARPHVSLYRFGRRQIGHVHHDGVVDLPCPRAVHDELISNGMAEPHQGGCPATVSYLPSDARVTATTYSQASRINELR
jgi:luciferase-like monooxygenase